MIYFAIEMEIVAKSHIARLKNGSKTQLFKTRREAQTIADFMDERVNDVSPSKRTSTLNPSGDYVSFEVIEVWRDE